MATAGIPINRYCEACGVQPGVYHVTTNVTIVGGTGNVRVRRKLAQFWLCVDCENKNRKVMRRDNGQRIRVARLLTTLPEFSYRWELNPVMVEASEDLA